MYFWMFWIHVENVHVFKTQNTVNFKISETSDPSATSLTRENSLNQ